MDFDAAIVAHARWKYRLTDYVDGKSKEKLDPKVVGCDDQCDLGKWLHSGECKNLACRELRDAHASFHRAAAAVVVLVNGGHPKEAHDALATSGEYAKYSAEVIARIKALRTAA